MRRQGVTNPEPAQGSQRPGLRGPGAEVLRLIGYPVVRQVLAEGCSLHSAASVAASRRRTLETTRSGSGARLPARSRSARRGAYVKDRRGLLTGSRERERGALEPCGTRGDLRELTHEGAIGEAEHQIAVQSIRSRVRETSGDSIP